MAPASRSVNTVLSRSKPSLEIIPDQRFIVFHGSEHEASPLKLTGRVRLHTPEATSILKPKIRLEGKRRVSWFLPQYPSRLVGRSTFWTDEQKLGSIESTHKVNAGTIEWPFEFQLHPSMPESVEGLGDTYIVYHLNASVVRPGWNAKDVLASEHVRIVRTIGLEAGSMAQPRVNSDIWANKVAYTVSIPSDAVVFGTSIVADIELTPLKKGIQFGTVEMRLIELVTKRLQEHEAPELRSDKSHSSETEIAKEFMEIPDDARILVDEAAENPTLEDEKYKFIAALPLPKSLNSCRQDVDHHPITITHRLKIVVNITNPEGHVSQLVCRLPVQLYISPNLPVDEANEVHLGQSRLTEAELNNTGAVVAAPPEYGRHQLDQIYRDIDINGFISRAGSGPGTPAGLMAQSRRGSHENVLSLNSLADIDIDPASSHHGQLLRSRLADLQISNAGHVLRPTGNSANHSPSGGASPAPGPSHTDTRPAESQPGRSSPDAPGRHQAVPSIQEPDVVRGGAHASYFPMVGATRASPLQHASSDEDTPTSSTYDLANLSRVPSYGAAIRTPTGSVTPFTEGPPSYVEATSRPPSPTQAQGHGHGHGHGHGQIPRRGPAQVPANA